MCGIAGIIHFDGRPVDSREITTVIQAMAVCPTDRIGHSCDRASALGHLMEFFWPEDRFESQPLKSADGSLICVADAALDNRPELAAALGWSATDGSNRADSAFVLAAYERWGESCVSQLEGKFALAVWHVRERRLFCAVDHLGHRPLYYWCGKNELVFATTLKGLFALPRISRALNETVLADYVARLDPEDLSATLYREVRRVPGGHFAWFDASGSRVVRHWHPDASKELHLRSDAEYLEAFRAEFERAVLTAIRRGPRHTGIMLSGGLDSSAVTAVAGRLLAAQGRRLQAIHLVPTEPNRQAGPLRELDESRYVEAMRDHAPHIDFHLVPHEAVALRPEDWSTRFEDSWGPFRPLAGHGATRARELLDRLDIGLLLDGGGGNLLVSLESLPNGYPSHLFFTGRWLRYLREFRGLRRVYGHPSRPLVRQTVLSPLKRLLWPAPSLGAGHHAFMLTAAVRARADTENRIRADEAAWTKPPLDYRQRLRFLLTEVARQQIGVAPSVIQRQAPPRLAASPLFDRRLNEFCLSLPFGQQIRAGWDRRLLRETMRGGLPDVVRLRVNRGFGQPAFRRLFQQSEPFLRAELDRLSRIPAAQGYLDFSWLEKHLDPSAERTPLNDRTLIDAVAVGRFLEWHERQLTASTHRRSD